MGKRVFIVSDRIGRGDDELGALLMRNFLYSLARNEERPTAVMLMNEWRASRVQRLDVARRPQAARRERRAGQGVRHVPRLPRPHGRARGGQRGHDAGQSVAALVADDVLTIA